MLQKNLKKKKKSALVVGKKRKRNNTRGVKTNLRYCLACTLLCRIEYFVDDRAQIETICTYTTGVHRI